MPTALITGASSGIGRATARHLRDRGYTVYAGYRAAADAGALAAEGLLPLPLDVTDPAQIAAAAAQLPALDALVNNAGINLGGPLECVPLETLRRVLEVNLVGAVAVTQAALPALRAAGGRVVFVSSVGGRVALPLVGPYNASKFGLEAAADALRRELRPEGLRVCVIEPGAARTAIWDKGRAAGLALLEELPAPSRARYGPRVERVLAGFARFERRALAPEQVARVIGRAITSPSPRARYRVGLDARLQVGLGWLLPDAALDALVDRLM
jgi:NAD(P)-dependent dehydrogenase (short-subunit alcohol dehydrogenase family)